MEPSVASQTLGFAAFAALSLALLGLCAWLRHHNARRVPVPSTGPRRCIDQHCANNGHYYRKAFADMWRCVNCGHLQPVSAQDLLDAAAEDFRGEFAQIEAFANGEVS